MASTTPSVTNSGGTQTSWLGRRTAHSGNSSQRDPAPSHHLKLSPKFSGLLKQYVKELFGFRSRAVHPNGAWVVPNYRPEIDSGVHSHLITFSGPHAKQCRGLTLVLLGSVPR